MTNDEFFTALEASMDKGFEWFFKHDDNFIRARNESQANTTFCPITVVAYIQTGRHFYVAEWAQASEVLGLEEGFGWKVIHACDKESDGAPEVQKMRRRLVRATRLDHRALVTQAQHIVAGARNELGHDLMDSSGVDLLLDNMPSLDMEKAIDIWEEVRGD